MNPYKLSIYLLFLSIFFTAVFAQDDPPSDEEIEVTESDCSELNAPQSECVPQSPKIEISDLTCLAEGIGIAKFSLCNLENISVTALSIDSSSQNFVTQLTPKLPMEVEPEMCIKVVVKGIKRKDTIDDCHPESKFCLKAYANKNPGFDCSGNYGFGYNFSSDSEYLKGMSGFVSLYNPKPKEEENDQ